MDFYHTLWNILVITTHEFIKIKLSFYVVFSSNYNVPIKNLIIVDIFV